VLSIGACSSSSNVPQNTVDFSNAVKLLPEADYTANDLFVDNKHLAIPSE